MSSVTQPYNSKIRITPYSQRLLQFGIEDSKVFLSKATNSLLLPWTLGNSNGFLDTTSMANVPSYEERNSCILDGLATSYQLIGNRLEVTVDPGSLIVDSTLLIFPEETTVDLDLTDYGSEDDCGIVFISVNFQWLDNINETTPTIKINYVHPDQNHVVEPNGWWLAQDKLIITAFDFNKNDSNEVIPESITNWVEDPTHNMERFQIDIKDLVYEVGPMPKLWYHILETAHANFTRKLTHTVPGKVDPTGMESSTITIPFELQNFEGIEVKSILTNLTWDSTKLENPRVESGPAAINSAKTAELNINASGDTAILQIDNELNHNAILDGVVAYVKFDIIRHIKSGDTVEVSFTNTSGVDVLLQAITLNGENEPELFMNIDMPYTVVRPTIGDEGDDWSIYWKYGTAPYHHTSREQFYTDIDISKVLSKDVQVQCFINDLKISPSGIQHINDKLVRVWMPDVFIYQDEIPDMKVIIIG